MFGDFYFISVARPVETVWVQGKPRVRRRRNLPNSLFSTDTSWYFRPASLTNFWLYQLCHICSPYYDLHYKLHQKRNFRNSGQYIYFWKNSEGGRKEWMTAFLPLCHKVSSNVFNSLHSLFIIAWTPSQISLCLINLFSLYIFQSKYRPYTVYCKPFGFRRQMLLASLLLNCYVNIKRSWEIPGFCEIWPQILMKTGFSR